MRILQLSNYYYPHIGGIEKIAQAISKSCAAEHDVEVVCFSSGNRDSEDRVDGVRIVRIGTQMKFASQQLSAHAYGIIKEEIRTFHPDCIIIHYPNPFQEAILLQLIPKSTRLIVYWHTDIVKQRLGAKLFHGLTLRLLTRADCVIATSPNYIEGSKYLLRFRDKCRVVPNCIDENALVLSERASALATELRQKYAGRTLCLCVGRQVPYKGLEYAVEALKHLNERYALVIIGSAGAATPGIRRSSDGMSNVELLGEADQETLTAYLAACDIFCFPSIMKNEAFGIALAEGMYFGKPAVTFTIPGSGVNYVSLDGVTGIEVENRNAERFAEAIRFLAEHPDTLAEYGENARKRVEEFFLYEQFQTGIREVLNGLGERI